MLKNVKKFNLVLESLGFYSIQTTQSVTIKSYSDHQTYMIIVGKINSPKLQPTFVKLNEDLVYNNSDLIEVCQVFITEEGCGIIMINKEIMTEVNIDKLAITENNLNVLASNQGLIVEIDKDSLKAIDPLTGIIHMIIIFSNSIVFVKNKNNTNLTILKGNSEKSQQPFYAMALLYAELIKENKEITTEKAIDIEEVDSENMEISRSIIAMIEKFNRIAIPLSTFNVFSVIVGILTSNAFKWIDVDDSEYIDPTSIWNKFKEKTVLYVDNENKLLLFGSNDNTDPGFNDVTKKEIKDKPVVQKNLLEDEPEYDTMTFDKVSSKESLIIKRDDIKDDLNINYKLEDLNDGWFKETSSMGEINYYSSSVVKINIKEEEWFVIDSMHSLF